MNSILYKMEKKFGKYAIKNLPMCIILCYITGYVINMIDVSLLDYFTLNPDLIFHGQIWRLITWIIVPPSELSIFTIIMLFFYYSIGMSLERVWGTFRFNLYIFSGVIFSVIGSFLMYVITPVLGTYLYSVYDASQYYKIVAGFFSTYYINMTLFLAYAATFPNYQVLLMFIIPIKVKYLGILYAFLLGYDLFVSTFFEQRFVIVVSVLNFLIFFLMTRNYQRISPKEVKRRNTFRKAVREGGGSTVTPLRGKNSITRHKCAICKRTEHDNEDLEFRFCSKCEGNYEYCSEHLFTHEHVKKM